MNSLLKKLLVSLSVILTFVGYAWHQQNEGSDTPVIVPPSPQPQTTSSPSSLSITTVPSSAPAPRSSGFKDGTYTGDIVDAYYGNVQVQATIKSGRISDVQFLDYPSDRRTSIEINSQAMPYLKQEAIQAQSAQVDTISGATQTSEAFKRSLQSALDKAKA